MVHVLIVDDDRAIRETLHFALEDTGYVVSEAGDGIAALQHMRMSKEPLVVLLDLMMPELDGAGVLGVVSADSKLSRNCRFILLTASTKTLTLAFAALLASLSVPVINKPFDIDDLLNTIEQATHLLSAGHH